MPRQSAAVYRRRRLVLLIGVILVIALIGTATWLLVMRPWESGASPAPQSSSSASASASDRPETTTPDPTVSETPSVGPSPDATPEIVACKAADIVVAAVADAETYASGVLPKLSISLTNKGDTDCTMDVGTSTQVFTVMSGSDTWWTSTDCQQDPSSQIATITAGTTVVSSEPVVWDRTRSSPETCDSENRQRAPGGGASYHVSVEIGGFTSMTSQQILLY